MDHRLNSYMFFVLVGSLGEGRSNFGRVYGVGIHKTDDTRSFYTHIGGEVYNESHGEFMTGRLENSVNFKYYLFRDDTANFVFEPLNVQPLTKDISEMLKSNGLSRSVLNNK